MKLSVQKTFEINERLRMMEEPPAVGAVPTLRIYVGATGEEFLNAVVPNQNPHLSHLSPKQIVDYAYALAERALPLLEKIDAGWRQIRHLEGAFFAEAVSQRSLNTGENSHVWAVFTDEEKRDEFVSKNETPAHGIDGWVATDRPQASWVQYSDTMLIAPRGFHISTDTATR